MALNPVGKFQRAGSKRFAFVRLATDVVRIATSDVNPVSLEHRALSTPNDRLADTELVVEQTARVRWQLDMLESILTDASDAEQGS